MAGVDLSPVPLLRDFYRATAKRGRPAPRRAGFKLSRVLNSARGILERDSSGEVETVDEDFFRSAECVDRSDAEAARNDTIGTDGATQGADALLAQFVGSTLVIAACGKQTLLAFEDYRHVRRERAACRTFGSPDDAKYHAYTSTIRA